MDTNRTSTESNDFQSTVGQVSTLQSNDQVEKPRSSSPGYGPPVVEYALDGPYRVRIVGIILSFTLAVCALLFLLALILVDALLQYELGTPRWIGLLSVVGMIQLSFMMTVLISNPRISRN